MSVGSGSGWHEGKGKTKDHHGEEKASGGNECHDAIMLGSATPRKREEADYD